MKRIITVCTVLIAILLCAALITGCGKKDTTDASKNDITADAGENKEPQNAGEDANVSEDAGETETPAAVDYSSPDLVVETFAEMEQFLDDWGELKWDGKVIKITGISARRMSNCTIMIKNDDGTGRGCSYEINDAAYPDDYPEDDAALTLTGVLYMDPSTGARVLQVPADQIVPVE